MKRLVYSALGRALLVSGRARRAMGNRAAVAVFHRVDDRFPGNPLTVSQREFRQYCDVFRRHFDVISVAELLDRLASGRSVGGAVAITFDDGYLDNHRIAAEELERAGLPACFFICTGFIGSDTQARWDVRDGATSEWMTWDDVRDLARRGFEIGAHTVSHPDLGRIAAAEAEREIGESRERLERELGTGVDLFCYPFGNRQQLSNINRDVVRRSGVRCCFSCYGGTVSPGDDPFELERAPISLWHRTPSQYVYELVAGEARGRAASA